MIQEHHQKATEDDTRFWKGSRQLSEHHQTYMKQKQPAEHIRFGEKNCANK